MVKNARAGVTLRRLVAASWALFAFAHEPASAAELRDFNWLWPHAGEAIDLPADAL